MASKSKPFSMKKPSKKQDVFRASQKSFFWRSWSAPGQCPMAVFIFFRFLGFLAENGSQNGPGKLKGIRLWRPKATQKRSKNVSATQARFFVDFGPPFGDIFKNLAYFLNLFRRHHRQFLQFLGLKMFAFHRRLPKGVGGRPATKIRRHRPVSWRDQTG